VDAPSAPYNEPGLSYNEQHDRLYRTAREAGVPLNPKQVMTGKIWDPEGCFSHGNSRIQCVNCPQPAPLAPHLAPPEAPAQPSVHLNHTE
jgi:hypothetical protein